MPRITKPRDSEPIRLIQTATGHRYRVVMDAGHKPNGKRRQITKTYRTLADARAFVAETRTELRHGTFTAPDRLTVDVLIDKWLASRTDVREVTRNGYSRVLLPVRTLLGGRTVQSIALPDVEAMMQTLATEGGQSGTPLSARSLSYTLGSVKQVFNYAVRAGILASSPAASAKVPRTDRKRAEAAVWTPEELLTFRSVADQDDLAAAWRLTLCGLRRSEVLGMTWDAVKLDTGSVEVRQGRVSVDNARIVTDEPKSAASRRVVPVEAIMPGTVSMLRSFRAQQAKDKLAAGRAYMDADLVAVDAIGRPIRPEAYSERFRALCNAAGVPQIRMHNARHTTALILHRAGVAPADAAALLGHSVAVHLEHYVPRTQAGIESAAAALGAALAATQ